MTEPKRKRRKEEKPFTVEWVQVEMTPEARKRAEDRIIAALRNLLYQSRNGHRPPGE